MLRLWNTSQEECGLIGRLSRIAWLVGAALLAVLSGYSADQPVVSIESRMAGVSPRATIRVDSKLVLIPVSVTDAANRPITGLPRDTFRVFEDGIEQKVLQFSSEDAPVSVGIVFDSSGSMGDKLFQSRAAVAQFCKTANPQDEFFLMEFSDRARLTVPFTTSEGTIQSHLMSTQSGGKTALLDAVYMALQYMKGARNERKALLVISDGADNESRYSEAEIRDIVRETDVWIYAIGIYRTTVMLPEEAPAGPRLLTALAEATGGRQFSLQNPNDLPDAAEKIGRELRNQYVLAFSPSDARRDSKYHKLRVKLVRQGRLHVSSRPGYYASAE